MMLRRKYSLPWAGFVFCFSMNNLPCKLWMVYFWYARCREIRRKFSLLAHGCFVFRLFSRGVQDIFFENCQLLTNWSLLRSNYFLQTKEQYMNKPFHIESPSPSSYMEIFLYNKKLAVIISNLLLAVTNCCCRLSIRIHFITTFSSCHFFFSFFSFFLSMDSPEVDPFPLWWW